MKEFRDIKVLVCGGRIYQDATYVYSILKAIHSRFNIIEIIEGGASGADRFARFWGNFNGIKVTTVISDWHDLSNPDAIIKVIYGRKYDAKAGIRRNEKMLALCPDWVLAFPGGTGTAHMHYIAMKAKLEGKIKRVTKL